ncbi:Protein translocase subunit SecY [Arthrobacter saudimassiliensis]|uniref:Protein translocase subunit SecY n=1 Tax=Arthrobacter saudimassiliensis TaxID=1461584 RepID=A0A078MTS8_9MICC|nr:Protein translocase subunit SecY [Arthrobacter saudimassiliensis]
MLSAIGRAFRTPDLRRKLLFTLGIITLYRMGTFIPAPGVDYGNVQQCLALGATTGGLYEFVNLFSGGALLQVSVFALGIMPYITASIIVQLLRVVIPRFQALHEEGQQGQARLTQYTRYLTIALGLLNATTVVSLARSGALFNNQCSLDIIPDDSLITILLIIITLTAGTGLIMWMGELVTEKGVGNGISLLIFTSIAASFPSSLGAILTSQGWTVFLGVLAIGVLVVALVIFVEQSQRRVPVQYAKRMIGRRTVGGTNTYIPIKVNMAGVIPVIFASSMLYLPALVAQFNTPADGTPPEWVVWINNYFVTGDHPLYMAVYFLLIVFFTYFYVSITFNPEEVSENMKKYGGFIPGIRAGRPTAEYLQYVLSRITLPGALYLGIVALIPLIALVLVGANQNFPFGGTSILIMVGVGLETVKQIDAQLQQRHYEGLLR